MTMDSGRRRVSSVATAAGIESGSTKRSGDPSIAATGPADNPSGKFGPFAM